MATEVQIALQPQAGQDPAAALTAAAAKLARSSLEMLVQQAGQPITGKIVPPTPNLPAGFSQVAVADMVLTLKLSTPLPVGTPVRIDVQQSQTGQPAVTVQPMPMSANPVPAPSVPMTPSALPLPQQVPLPVQSTLSQQPATAVQQSPASTPATPTSTPPQPPTANATAPQQPQALPATISSPAPAATSPQQSPAPTPAGPPQPSAPVVTTTSLAAPAPAPAPASATPATLPQTPAPQQAQTSVVAMQAPAPSAASQPAPLPPTLPASLPQQASVQAPTASVQPSVTPVATTTAAQVVQPQATVPQSVPGPQSASQSAAPAQTLVQRLTQALASPSATTTAPAPPPVPGSPAQLVMAATTQAAAQQQSPAPLLQALAVSLPHLPQPIAAAAARVLATRINLDRGMPTGESLKQAVLKSGIFLEAPAKPGSPPDLKQALGQLRGTLLAWLGDDIAPVAPVARRPPPPARGSLPRAQAPELPPSMEAGGKEAGKALLGQTEGALARIKLMQLGSHTAEAARPAIAAPGEWHLELPLMLGHELAMAQIQIQRDGKGKAEAKEKSWRLRFALKFSVLGEVGAQVTMVGLRTSIAIWADEEATAETLEAMLPELAPSLAAKGLELVSLTVRRGAPKDENQQAGRLMDSTR